MHNIIPLYVLSGIGVIDLVVTSEFHQANLNVAAGHQGVPSVHIKLNNTNTDSRNDQLENVQFIAGHHSSPVSI